MLYIYTYTQTHTHNKHTYELFPQIEVCINVLLNHTSKKKNYNKV
jgi:hypothetical protein